MSNCHNTRKVVYIVSYLNFKKIIGKKEKTGKLSMVRLSMAWPLVPFPPLRTHWGKKMNFKKY